MSDMKVVAVEKVPEAERGYFHENDQVLVIEYNGRFKKVVIETMDDCIGWYSSADECTLQGLNCVSAGHYE